MGSTKNTKSNQVFRISIYCFGLLILLALGLLKFSQQNDHKNVRTPASMEHEISQIKSKGIEIFEHAETPTSGMKNETSGADIESADAKALAESQAQELAMEHAHNQAADPAINEMAETAKINAEGQVGADSQTPAQTQAQASAPLQSSTNGIALTPGHPQGTTGSLPMVKMAPSTASTNNGNYGRCLHDRSIAYTFFKKNSHFRREPNYRIPKVFYERLGPQKGHLVKCPAADHGHHLVDDDVVGNHTKPEPLSGMSIEARDYALSLTLRERLQIHMYTYGYVVYDESGSVMAVEIKD
jgi:hypothetical protein